MKRIRFFGDFSDNFEEGLVKITRKLRQSISAEYDILDSGPYDIAAIHSSGFLEAMKYRRVHAKKIYWLHSDLQLRLRKEIIDSIQFYRHLISPRKDVYAFPQRLLKSALRLLAAAIPLGFKRHYLAQMDLVIVPNQQMKDALNLTNAIVIRHGIDTTKYTIHRKPEKTPHVGYFGHPTVNKGVLELATAFAGIDTAEKHMYFTNMNNKIRRFIAAKDNTIHVHGLIDDMPREYNRTDVVVLPFRHSGGAIATPLVLLEAMACGCAVITTDLPHLHEICGDSVIYVPPHDAQTLRHAISDLTENPKKRRRLGRKAHDRVARLYDEKRMVREYKAVLDRFTS